MVEVKDMLNFTFVRRCSFPFTSDSNLFKFVPRRSKMYTISFAFLTTYHDEQQKNVEQSGI
jgi:hypothetical protein